MGGFSGEMIFLAFLGLILFGPRKLPEIAKTLGRLVAELKQASTEFQGQLQREVGDLEFEDPTKNLLGSLADGLKALHAVSEPVKAIVALAEPAKIKEQLTGPSFITNLSEYINETGKNVEDSKPGKPVVVEADSPGVNAEKVSAAAESATA